MRDFEACNRERRALLAAVPVALIGACSESAPEPETPGATLVDRSDIADVIYRPGATDEGILTLLNARPVSDVAAAPVVTAPAPSARLTTPTTFEYRSGTASLLRAPSRRAWRLSDWFVLERSAFAHGAPMNGDAFFVAFATSREPKLLRVFTQERTYVPTDDEWQLLAGAGETISLTVTRGTFEQGRLTADGGPFVGQALHFSVGA